MAYDETLADRIRTHLRGRPDVSEKKMFGGLSFLLRGNMCCGVVGGDLCLRLGNDGTGRALTRKHVRVMDFTGRPLRSMVYVEPAGLRTAAALEAWIGRAVEFTETLPAR
jgi:TfoX/Sxy family transcriptional regulator of competence genes